MTKLLLLAALIGLSTGALLRTEPRQLADTAEHALGWVCRMTFNDSGGVSAVFSDVLTGSYPRRTTGESAAAVTFFLRMLGLPRLRATPVELRQL